MRVVIIALALSSSAALPIYSTSALAQSSAQTVTPPSRMGRWDEFRQRQEMMQRLETRYEQDGKSPKQSAPAGYENKQATLADFADCAVAQAPAKTAALLATTPHTRAEGLALRKFGSMESCTRGRAFVSARTGEMRGALAEAALRGNRAKLTALATRSAASPVRITERAAGTRPFVIAYGQCLAKAAPARAVSLLSTAHGSNAEKAAMMAFGEPLKACMPEKVAYSLNIRDVRNHVADVLYRMSAGT